MTGLLKMDSFTLAPQDTQVFGFDYYIGPKEFDRVSRVGENTEEGMQFGFFGAISKLLLTMMNGFYSFFFSSSKTRNHTSLFHFFPINSDWFYI